MKKVKVLLSLILSVCMILSTATFAALPQTSGGGAHGLPAEYYIGGYNANTWGVTKTITAYTDAEMGSGYRITTNPVTTGDASRFCFYFRYGADNSVNADIQPGDKFYLSFYYRTNTKETDPNVTGEGGKMTVSNYLHTDGSFGSSTEVVPGEWNKYEQIITYNGTGPRTWWESALHFWWGGFTKEKNLVYSMDMTNIRFIQLGAATDEEEKTVIEQLKDTFSMDSSITSLKFGNKELLEDGVTEYTVQGNVTDVLGNIYVTTTNPNATVKKIDDGGGVYRILIYSEKADLTDENPPSNLYTEYIINYEAQEAKPIEPTECSIARISTESAGKAITTNEAFVDPEMGKGIRFTTRCDDSNSQTRDNARILLDVRTGPKKTGDIAIANGDKYYFSCYYRVNTPETDPNINSTTTKLSMPTTMRNSTKTTDVSVTPGEWARYEGFIIMDASKEPDQIRRWSDNSCMVFFGSLNKDAVSTYSFDLCGIRILYIKDAQDNSNGTVLEQVYQTFSNDSTVSSVKVGESEIYEEGKNVFTAIGSAEEVVNGLKVTTTAKNATPIVKKISDSQCKLTVYSEKANILDANDNEKTEYIINCITPEAIIPENNGRGTAWKFSGLFPREGKSVRTQCYDSAMGTIYRFQAEYTEQYLWPKFDLCFTADGTQITAGDLFYFSYYWRSNTKENDEYISVSPKYIARGTAVNSNNPTTNLGQTSDSTLLPGEWHKVEYIIPVNETNTVSAVSQVLQWGADNYGDTISIDFAGLKCYYLGAASYTGLESGKEAALISKLSESFTDNNTIAGINLFGRDIDLAQFAQEFKTAGSADKVLNSVLVVPTADDAYVSIAKADAQTVEIKVVSHKADLRNLSASDYTTYIIKNDLYFDVTEVSVDGNEIDYSALGAGKYSICATLKNETDNAFGAKMVVAASDENGTLMGVGNTVLEAAASSNSKFIECDLTVQKAPKYFNVYVWNGMTPVITKTTISEWGIVE